MKNEIFILIKSGSTKKEFDRFIKFSGTKYAIQHYAFFLIFLFIKNYSPNPILPFVTMNSRNSKSEIYNTLEQTYLLKYLSCIMDRKISQSPGDIITLSYSAK